MKLKQIKKLTNLQYLNMYSVSFDKNGKNFEYYFSSRRNIQDLACNSVKKTDAVRILPYIILNGNMYAVVIKEFRHALNQYIYSTPAGLVDDNEDSIVSAKRELLEEIGAKVIKIDKVLNNCYSSAGLTDECLDCFEAEVVLTGKQNLEETEDITIKLLNVNDILSFIDNNQFDMQSALMLQAFYYKTLYQKGR